MCIVVTVLCNQPEAFASVLIGDWSYYLFMKVLIRPDPQLTQFADVFVSDSYASCLALGFDILVLPLQADM